MNIGGEKRILQSTLWKNDYVQMSFGKSQPGQLLAIAWLRWRLFVNVLRSTRGQLELLSRILVSLAFLAGGFGGAVLMGLGAYFFLTSGKPQMLAALLWGIFFFWQLFPIMATAFTNNPDSSELLRFPLGYSRYFLVRLAYGVVDPATYLGSIWSLGILVGLSLAKFSLLPWAALILLTFVFFNLLFLQMIFAWVERWLAQRQTRELMGILFVLVMLSFQLIGPLTGHFRKRPNSEMQRVIAVILPAQQILPPGLAADAIVQGIYPQWTTALSSLGLLCGFILLAGYGLHVRLFAQYRGENLSEVVVSSVLRRNPSVRLGWSLPGFSAPVAAVFEKEIRYVLRSGPMLLNFAMPFFMLVVFRFSAMNSLRHSGTTFFSRTPSLAFPVAAAYMLLMLTNVAFNNFGADAAGIQFFYASPASFRQIVLAKNLACACIVGVETILAWFVVALFYDPPRMNITLLTLAGLLFAAPLDFAAGNLLSVYAPKRFDYSKFGRQRASQLTVLISMGLQVVVAGVAVGAVLMARYLGSIWIAALVLALLAIVSFSIYVVTLNRINRLALNRRETLLAELCRT
jgi:ABC-2 type transport system permease protein